MSVKGHLPPTWEWCAGKIVVEGLTPRTGVSLTSPFDPGVVPELCPGVGQQLADVS